jgi:hypothetical protein
MLVMLALGLTDLAKVHVVADHTFVPDSFDRGHLTEVADEVGMNHLLLSFMFLLLVLSVEVLKYFLGVRRCLVLNKLVNFVDKLTFQLSGSVASAARASFTVQSRSFASGALNRLNFFL